YRSHGTKLAPWSDNQSYSRGVNFAPNVEPISGQSAPLWSLANANCTLVCHGASHDSRGY
ncbi:MAG: hypothetical protein Q7T33_09030, partial [Dehalococcoidia bacterium]|nr:hypothetical protein [Dehalococcoidia bacterium]